MLRNLCFYLPVDATNRNSMKTKPPRGTAQSPWSSPVCPKVTFLLTKTCSVFWKMGEENQTLHWIPGGPGSLQCRCPHALPAPGTTRAGKSFGVPEGKRRGSEPNTALVAFRKPSHCQPAAPNSHTHNSIAKLSEFSTCKKRHTGRVQKVKQPA